MQPNPQTAAEREFPTNETIVAISTPPGRVGIGIVRLSGPRSIEIATPLLSLRGELEHARARIAEIIDPETRASPYEKAVRGAAPAFSWRGCTGKPFSMLIALASPIGDAVAG